MGVATNQTTTVKFAQWSTAHETVSEVDVSEVDLDKFVDVYWQSHDDVEDDNMDF